MGQKNEAAPAKIEEIAEAICVGIRRQPKDALGLGNRSLAAKHIVKRANCCRIGAARFSLLTAAIGAILILIFYL
jgi:hypothetical protein